MGRAGSCFNDWSLWHSTVGTLGTHIRACSWRVYVGAPLIESTVSCHFITLFLQLRQVVLVLIIGHLDEVLETEVWRHWVVLAATKRTHLFLFGHTVNASLAKSVTTWKQNVRLIARGQKQFEAYGASIRHDLVVKCLFSSQLTLRKFGICWLWHLLLVSRLQLCGHSRKQLVNHLRFVPLGHLWWLYKRVCHILVVV